MTTNINLNEVTTDTQGVISITYTNYKGEKRLRSILPIKLVLKHSEYHSVADEPVWVVEAYDLEKQVMRDFALTDFN